MSMSMSFLTCMSPMMRGLKPITTNGVHQMPFVTYMHVPDDEGIETSSHGQKALLYSESLTCMSPMMRGLKLRGSLDSLSRTLPPYMHVPDDEGIETPHADQFAIVPRSTPYMHVPDDEGIETLPPLGHRERGAVYPYMHVPDDEGIETGILWELGLKGNPTLTCMSPMMRGLKLCGLVDPVPYFKGLTCMSPMMRGLKPAPDLELCSRVPSSYMHVPDDEGIETTTCIHAAYRMRTSVLTCMSPMMRGLKPRAYTRHIACAPAYMHVPDDEGIETCSRFRTAPRAVLYLHACPR